MLLARYERTERFEQYPGRSHPKPGEAEINGSFIYRNYKVTFARAETVPGLIVYSKEKLTKPKQEQKKNTQSNPYLVVTFLPMAAPTPCAAGGGGSAYDVIHKVAA